MKETINKSVKETKEEGKRHLLPIESVKWKRMIKDKKRKRQIK